MDIILTLNKWRDYKKKKKYFIVTYLQSLMQKRDSVHLSYFTIF